MNNVLKKLNIETPLGVMIAVADENFLYFLDFVDRNNLEQQIKNLQAKTQSTITPGLRSPLISIEKELKLYFSNQLKEFKTPIAFLGTPFQNSVWEQLNKIPHGQTRSYLAMAQSLQKPTAFRAVAQANSKNKLAIIIPCHRVINENGALGGYAGGITRKQWLLEHEKNN